MSIQVIIRHINQSLVQTFAALDTWFLKEAELRRYRPLHGGWTIDEILEHVGLTNHFLLILIHKATRKALQNAQHLDLATALTEHTFQEEKLAEIGRHKAFPWIRPEHMEPTGRKLLPEVRQQLEQQLQECLQTLDNLPNGEGILYKTTMSVNNLGKIDVYEYLYFLAQHGQRHLQQMARNEAEFQASSL